MNESVDPAPAQNARINLAQPVARQASRPMSNLTANID
jgi:hypothetical protein